MLGGFYRAEVVNSADPLGKHRVRLRIPSVFGAEITGWAEPLFPTLVPESGTVVWAAFEAGIRDRPLYLAPQAAISGGEPGQVLVKSGSADYALAWQDSNDHLHDEYSPIGHGH